MIADVLGGKVSKNQFKEIGWFPISLTRGAKDSSIFSSLPSTFTAFQWHGDTFKIPSGAKRLGQSEGCANQAFEYGRAIGLQFHLEYSRRSIDLMLQYCRDELVDGKYIQKQDEIISRMEYVTEMNKTLNLILDNMEREFGARF